MISRKKSINKPSEFYKLKKEGVLIKSDNFHLRYVGYSEFKVAFVVSKVISPISPKRNRLKRVYKSLIKDLDFNKKVLLVIYPKLSSLEKKYSELKLEFSTALEKIRY